MASRVGDIVIDCAEPDILFIRVPERKATKNRVHFDVCPTDRDQEDELARLLDLGARRSSTVGSGSWVVLDGAIL
jgi:hypothetical protein